VTNAADRHALVRSRAEQRLGGTLDAFESPLTVLASPAWRGIEADIWLARRGGQAEIYKHYHPDTDHYVDARAAIAAARQAGELGAGPQVLDSWDGDGLFVMEHLGEGWRAGGLHDSARVETRAAIVAAKKRFRSGAALPRDGDIFAEIRVAHRACVDHGANLPRNIAAFLDFAGRAEAAMADIKIEHAPCHRDGNTANWMIGPGGRVLLVDYDLSANGDPYEDIGFNLTELFEREAEARDGFAEWTGCFDEALFQRAMVYGILDDLRWALVAQAMAARSERKTLEFAKYASWRLMRYETNSQNSSAADRLRRLA